MNIKQKEEPIERNELWLNVKPEDKEALLSTLEAFNAELDGSFIYPDHLKFASGRSCEILSNPYGYEDNDEKKNFIVNPWNHGIRLKEKRQQFSGLRFFGDLGTRYGVSIIFFSAKFIDAIAS